MTIDDIQRLVKGDETRTLELKKSTGELKDAMQSACAFLNTDGGWLLFGVAPKSLKLVGQQVTDSTRREIAHELTKIEPAIDIRVEYVDLPDKDGFQVIAMHFDCWLRGTVPFTFDSRPYYRVESTTKLMPRAMFEARIKESRPHLFAWECQTADRMTVDDLDEEAIRNSVRGGVLGGRLSSTALTESTEQILSKFKLLHDGKLLNAAVALYAKDNFGYPQLLLRMARFKGTGKNEFGDNMQAEGHFFKLLDAGMAFFFKHLNLSGKIEGLQRKETLEIPVVALREALINALCHRRYDSPSPSVGIAIYDDRVEIENPGEFPPQLTPDNIKQPHDSYPRNPLMASVLYQTTYLERWGSGVKRIVEACHEHGVPEPFYEERMGFVHIIFKRRALSIMNDTQNGTQNDTQTPTNAVGSLSERQQKLLEMIRRVPNVSMKELAAQLSVSRITIVRDIKKINEHTTLVWEGASKTGHWMLDEL